MALVNIPDSLLQSQDPEIFILEKLVNEQVANAGAVSSLSAKDGKSPHFQLSHTTPFIHFWLVLLLQSIPDISYHGVNFCLP